MKNALGGVVGEGKKPHTTKSKRKLITSQEWADYIGVSRLTIVQWLKKYQLLFEYDSHDIYSVFDFLRFALKKRGNVEQ